MSVKIFDPWNMTFFSSTFLIASLPNKALDWPSRSRSSKIFNQFSAVSLTKPWPTDLVS